MNAKGRRAALLLAGFGSLGFIFAGYAEPSYKPALQIALAICCTALGWRLGVSFDRMMRLSVIDPLTDSYNRRHMEALFPRLRRTADAGKKQLFLFLIDVDHFKFINDRYGHDTGDRVLRQVSDALRTLAGEKASVFRWGGDEFLIVLPGSEKAESDRIQTHLRDKLRRLSLESMPIVVSAGGAAYPNDGSELGELLRAADRDMYRDKFEKQSGLAIQPEFAWIARGEERGGV